MRASGGPAACGGQRVRLGAGGESQECGCEPAQVVEQRCDGVGDGEGGEPSVAAVDGGGEDLELADEHGGGRGADQAEEADDEDGGGSWGAAGQPPGAGRGGRGREVGDRRGRPRGGAVPSVTSGTERCAGTARAWKSSRGSTATGPAATTPCGARASAACRSG